MKKCNKCNIEKLITEFNKLKTAKDGLQYMCRSCQKDYREDNKENHKQYLINNKEHIEKVRVEYWKNNIKHIRKVANKYQKELHQSEGYGVYLFFHIPTQKYYIGEGWLFDRKKHHLSYLKKGKSQHSGIQNLINPYPNIDEWGFKVIKKWDFYNKKEGRRLEKEMINERLDNNSAQILNIKV